MNLSSIKGGLVIDVIADLVVPIANIAMDNEASEIFSKKPLPAGMSVKEFTARRWSKSLPKLLKNHKDDIIMILATLSQKTVEEYSDGLTIITLLNDFVELMNDETFTQLFFSAQSDTVEESSGNAQVNTEAKV